MKDYGLLLLAVSGIAALGTGCVERQVVYVPAQPGVTIGPAVAEQAPPPTQVEVVPAAPGPEYVWMPGYWSIGVGGSWVWIGGRYAVPPRPHAVWVGGHWARHGRGYVWIGGHWR
jgi:hypothetical protein